MIEFRQYQKDAVNNVMLAWQRGVDRVCLVAPTGSGKTVMAHEIVNRALEAGAKILAIAHRQELVEQMQERFGPNVYVDTIQTLLRQDYLPEAHLIIFDECHHYVSDEWSKLLLRYGPTRVLGLTATPERPDGRGLGDMFQEMVVACHYSHLLHNGWISPCDVFSLKGIKGLASSPSKAYMTYTPGTQALCFVGTIEHAYTVANEFAGIPCAVIEAGTNKHDRKRYIDEFKSHKLNVLINVYTLTEGIDIPDAQTCILARNVGHASTYLQMVGRVLRASPGKAKATLLDLSGAFDSHGPPTADREYSLDGEAIKRKEFGSLRVCMRCGFTHNVAPRCPRCGFTYPIDTRKAPIIYDRELRLVYDGANTNEVAKRKEFERLRSISDKFGAAFVANQYRKLFGHSPPSDWFTEEEKLEAYRKYQYIAKVKGYKEGFAKGRFMSQFGHWPLRAWG